MKPQLITLGVPVAEWRIVVRAFVRRDRYDYIKSSVENLPDAKVEGGSNRLRDYFKRVGTLTGVRSKSIAFRRGSREIAMKLLQPRCS